MEIYIPQELKDIPGFEGDFRFFIDVMVRKLHLNRHKGFIDSKPMDHFMRLLQNEYQELGAAVQSQAQFDVALECADIGNCAFLLAMFVLQKTKEEYTRGRKIHGTSNPTTFTPSPSAFDGSQVGRYSDDPPTKRS